MFFRIRVELQDRPGTLARLTSSFGAAGINVLALQMFPDLETVTDVIVVRAPEGWGRHQVGAVVVAAVGAPATVEPCWADELADPVIRWLHAARDVVDDPDLLPHVVRRLLGPSEATWSATEHARESALRELARRADAVTDDLVRYEVDEESVTARLGGHSVGVARLLLGEAVGSDGEPLPPELTIEVSPSWRRLGIGTQLFRRVSEVALASGVREVSAAAPAREEGVLPMLAALGLRPRVRLEGETLSIRLVLDPLLGRSAPRRAG